MNIKTIKIKIYLIPIQALVQQDLDSIEYGNVIQINITIYKMPVPWQLIEYFYQYLG